MEITLTIDDERLEELKKFSEKTKIPLERLLKTVIEACDAPISIVHHVLADKAGLRIEDEEIKLYAAIQQALKIGAEFYKEVIAKILEELDALGEFVVEDLSLEENELWLDLVCARDSDLNIDGIEITVDIESGAGEILAYCYLHEDTPEDILGRIERLCRGEIREDEEEKLEDLRYLMEELENYEAEIELDRDALAVVFSVATEDYDDFPSMRMVSDLIGEILERSGYADWLIGKEGRAEE